MINLAIILTLLFGVAFKCNESGRENSDGEGGGRIDSSTRGAPTKAEIKQTIAKRFRAIRLSDKEREKIQDVEFDFDDGSIKIGNPVEKQIKWGEGAKMSYPVKVLYAVTTIYTDGRPPKTEEYGKALIEYFYKDGYGEWKARFGGDY